MKVKDNVTIIMNTFKNLDFTKASEYSIRTFYKDIRIIYADGSDDHETESWVKEFKIPETAEIVRVPGATFEDCLKAAASLVETEFMLISNQNVKFEHPGGQIQLLLEPFENNPKVAQTGAYGVKVVDWAARRAYCSTNFDGIMELDACSGYLTLHRTRFFMRVGGQPKLHFYKNIPKELNYKWASDLSIGNLYKDAGYKIMSPRTHIPHLYWSDATGYFTLDPYREWWHKNVLHTRINPLNDWEKHEK